jgi:hypothetical protein
MGAGFHRRVEFSVASGLTAGDVHGVPDDVETPLAPKTNC